MAKRPTPKKRRAKSKGKTQHAEYQKKQTRKLTAKRNSPYAVVAEPKNKAKTKLKGITRIKA